MIDGGQNHPAELNERIRFMGFALLARKNRGLANEIPLHDNPQYTKTREHGINNHIYVVLRVVVVAHVDTTSRSS